MSNRSWSFWKVTRFLPFLLMMTLFIFPFVKEFQKQFTNSLEGMFNENWNFSIYFIFSNFISFQPEKKEAKTKKNKSFLSLSFTLLLRTKLSNMKKNFKEFSLKETKNLFFFWQSAVFQGFLVIHSPFIRDIFNVFYSCRDIKSSTLFNMDAKRYKKKLKKRTERDENLSTV
jgi:hypothetical protein